MRTVGLKQKLLSLLNQLCRMLPPHLQYPKIVEDNFPRWNWRNKWSSSFLGTPVVPNFSIGLGASRILRSGECQEPSMLWAGIRPWAEWPTGHVNSLRNWGTILQESIGEAAGRHRTNYLKHPWLKVCVIKCPIISMEFCVTSVVLRARLAPRFRLRKFSKRVSRIFDLKRTCRDKGIVRDLVCELKSTPKLNYVVRRNIWECRTTMPANGMFC